MGTFSEAEICCVNTRACLQPKYFMIEAMAGVTLALSGIVRNIFANLSSSLREAEEDA